MKNLREALDEYKIKLADNHNMHPAFDRGFGEAVELLFPLVETLEKINEDFGTDYADGNVMLANQALADLKAKLGVE